MNIVFVNGGNRLLKEIAHRTVAFCIDELMPRSNKLEIRLDIKAIKSEAAGYTLMGDSRYEYELEIEKDQTMRDFVGTICHEMVHVMQYYKKKMDAGPSEGTYRWGKERIPENTQYSDLPWEKEAYKLQYELADKVWLKNLI